MDDDIQQAILIEPEDDDKPRIPEKMKRGRGPRKKALEEEFHCPECGAVITKEEAVCPECGVELGEAPLGTGLAREPEFKEFEEEGETTTRPSADKSRRPPMKLTPEYMKLIAGGIILIVLISVIGVFLLDSEEIDVTVNVPDMRTGDEARYKISGSIDIKDADDDPIFDEILSGMIDLDGSTLNTKVQGTMTVTDGYFREYSALKTYSFFYWKIDGYVDTLSYDKVDVTGTVQLSNNAYRNGDAILLSDLEAITNLHAQSQVIGIYQRDVDSNDHLRAYSSASGNLYEDFDEIIHKENLEKGMRGEIQGDGETYSWEVIGAEKVFNTKCAIVEFKMQEPNEDIEYQSLKLYLSNEHPIPVKISLKVIYVAQGRVTVQYSMTMNHFRRGTEPVVIPEDNIINVSPYLEKETMELYPPTGTRTNSSINYELKDAHEKAEEKSGLDSYLQSHGDAYIVQGIYNETDGPVWNLTYSYPDADEGYVVLVTESKVTDNGEMKLHDAGPALEVNNPAPDTVLTWAGAEQIFKHDDEVKDNCFTGGHLNLGECNIGVRTSLYQPSVDLVSMFASAPEVEYGYTLTKGDEIAVGVNADDGQLLFVATHEGPELF